MIKQLVKPQLDIKHPTEYIYKLRLIRNELTDLEMEFHKNCTWCVGCQTYAKIQEAREVSENGRIVMRCDKCGEILKFNN
jgi:RNase P subunit RPR2